MRQDIKYLLIAISLIIAFFAGACSRAVVTRDVPKAAFEELATDLAEIAEEEQTIKFSCDIEGEGAFARTS